MAKIIGVYKITSPTKRVYIGQSTNIKYRISQYKAGRCKNQTKLHRSILKYGWDNHTFQLLSECDIDQLNDLERYYQELFNCLHRTHGLNCKLTTTKSRSGKFSEETKSRISIAHKGKKLSKEHVQKIKERVITPEWRKNMSIAQTGKKRSPESIAKGVMKTTGLKRTDEFRKYLSEINKGNKHTLGFRYSDEYKRERSESAYQSKQVIDTSTGIIYSSMKKCALSIGMPFTSLTQKLSGFRKNTTTIKYYIPCSQQKEHSTSL